MGVLGHLLHGVRRLLRLDDSDRDIADEAHHFFAEAEADLVARGATPEAARREVRLRYGDEVAAREHVAAGLWETHVETLVADLLLAVRRLSRSPGFVALVVVILGLGVGSATAIYSVVRPTLLDPLGYPDADRIVTLSYRLDDGEVPLVAFGTVLEIEARSRDFAALGAARPWRPTLAGENEPIRLVAQSVSAEYFDVLGVRPRFGSGFDAAEDRPGGARTVVLSDELWRLLGADPGAIGTTVRLDGTSFTVVGVMAEGFENVTLPGAQAWTLLRYDPSAVADHTTREWGIHLGLVGRLRRDVSMEQVSANLDAIAASPVPDFPRPEHASLERGFAVHRLHDVVTASARPTALLLTGAAVFLLVIACVNLTVLFLGRATQRQGELAVRAAFGAGRQRIAKQLVTESLLVAALGGVAALAAATSGVDALVRLSPPTLDNLDRIRVDAGSLVVAVALTTAIGLAVGLAPLLFGSRRALNGAVRGTPPGLTRRQAALRRALVVGEVSSALVLLVGAGLLVRTTDRLFAVPLGFDPGDAVVMQVYGTSLQAGDANIHRFFDLALESTRGVNGARAVAMTNQMPLSGDGEVFGVRRADPEAAPDAGGSAFRYGVSPGYFEVLGIPVVAGRALGASDQTDAPRAAVVSRSLARRLFGDQDPLGRDITIGAATATFSVVGVVEDVKHSALDSDETQAVYTTSHQWHWADRVRWVVVKSELGSEEAIRATRDAIWAVDRNQPIVRGQALERLVERSESVRVFVTIVLVFFAVIAVTLAAAGLYGVLASAVSARRRELGIRAALGASSDRLTAFVFRQGLVLAVIGVGLGTLVALLGRRVVAPFLFGVSAADPTTYVGVAGLLLGVAGLACWLPASRAAKADPLAVLRAE